MALEAFFDGSKDPCNWRDSRYITLAGFAAEDDIWADFERGWAKVLADDTNRPKAAYLHMREVNGLEQEFSWRNGWNRKKTSIFIGELLSYMRTIDKKRFHMFAATVDMAAYSKVSSEGIALRDPIRICTDFCCDVVLAWYFRDYPGLIHSAHFFFDPSEPFREVFKQRCFAEQENKFDATGLREAWSMVKTISDVMDMRDKPAMQAADLLAWSSNRNLTAGEGEFGKYYHALAKQVIPSHWQFISEDILRNYPRPPWP